MLQLGRLSVCSALETITVMLQALRRAMRMVTVKQVCSMLQTLGKEEDGGGGGVKWGQVECGACVEGGTKWEVAGMGWCGENYGFGSLQVGVHRGLWNGTYISTP